MEKLIIKVNKDFSMTPGPRYAKEGDFSGEEFRTKILAPLLKKAIQSNTKIIIDLDGAAGYGTSFLEEVFGGLIRNDKFRKEDVDRIVVVSEEEDYLIEDIKEYIHDAIQNR